MASHTKRRGGGGGKKHKSSAASVASGAAYVCVRDPQLGQHCVQCMLTLGAPVHMHALCRSTFIGFGAFAADADVKSAKRMPLTPFYAGSDPEIKVGLKRLAKRDATTKLKALASLRLLFKKRPSDIVQVNALQLLLATYAVLLFFFVFSPPSCCCRSCSPNACLLF